MNNEAGTDSNMHARTDRTTSDPVRSTNDRKSGRANYAPVAFVQGFSEQTYEAIASRVLRSDQQFAWLFEDGDNARARRSLLIELGRLPDEALLREAAAVLCEQRPDPERAIAMVRQLHQGLTRTSTSALNLSSVVMKAVQQYLAANPDTSDAAVVEALNSAAGALVRSRIRLAKSS